MIKSALKLETKMKTSFSRFVKQCPVPLLQYRHFSDRPIHIIKSNLVKDKNVLEKLGKKEFKILKQLGFEFKESIEDDNNVSSIDNDDYEYEISHDIKYPAGHFPNQYPSIAHQNICEFNKNLMTNSKLEDWQIDNKTAQKLGLSVSSTIDYYPFPLTYPVIQQKKSPKSKSSSYPKPWQLIERKYALQLGYNFIDSIGDKVPILTRKINKTQDQTVVIYRDLHHNLSNLNKMETLMNSYKPDKIILELGPDGGSVAFKSFNKLRCKYLIFPMLKFRAKLIIRKSQESNVGKRWMNMMQRLFCVLPPSYSSVMATHIAMDRKNTDEPIEIILGDYPQRNIVPMLAFAEAMDVYQTAFYKEMKLPYQISLFKSLHSNLFIR